MKPRIHLRDGMWHCARTEDLWDSIGRSPMSAYNYWWLFQIQGELEDLSERGLEALRRERE